MKRINIFQFDLAKQIYSDRDFEKIADALQVANRVAHSDHMRLLTALDHESHMFAPAVTELLEIAERNTHLLTEIYYALGLRASESGLIKDDFLMRLPTGFIPGKRSE